MCKDVAQGRGEEAQAVAAVGPSDGREEGEGAGGDTDKAAAFAASLPDDSRRLQCECLCVCTLRSLERPVLSLWDIQLTYYPFLSLPPSLPPSLPLPPSPLSLVSSAMLEAQGLPPHLLGALGSKMQYILQKSFSMSSSNCKYNVHAYKSKLVGDVYL